jgi:serine/threonine protein kinase
MTGKQTLIIPDNWDDHGPISQYKKFVRLVTKSGQPDGEEFVMKCRPTSSGKRKLETVAARFDVEADLMKKIRGTEGVIPIVDIDGSSAPAWFVMPKAVPLAEHLHGKPDLRVTVESIRHIANALVRVKHSQGAAHRDIKPDNLLWLGGPLVADFGIAQVPKRKGLTPAGEKVGPTGFLAPEMRHVTPGVDGFQADVWSLAVTLFFLARPNNDGWPPVGTLLARRPEFSLYPAGGVAAYRLEWLLESATDYSPFLRPTMEVFADELAVWLESLNSEEGKRPQPTISSRTRRASFSRQHLHPAAALWSRRNRTLYEHLRQMLHMLAPGRFSEAGALSFALDTHGHNEESFFEVHAFSSTVATSGRRVVVLGFLVDGSKIEYFGEVQQRNVASEDGPFTLVRTVHSDGAVEWPSGERAASNMREMLSKEFENEDFPVVRQ